MRITAFLVVLVTLAVSTVSASAVTYNFSNSANPSGPFTLGCQAGGLLNGGGCAVTYNSAGLGVNGKPDLHPGEIDGIPGWEILTVTFNYAVLLENVVFGKWDNNDDYQLSLNGGAFGAVLSANPLSVNQIVTSFAIKASNAIEGFLGLGNDSFTLKKFTISEIPVNAIPVPAALPLFGAGLLGLGLLGRRRKRVAA